MDTLLFASLMGLYYWFARLRLGYTFSAMLLQPVVIAVFVGLLLGNMQTAMIIGAGMQLVYLGVTSTPGGNVPSDPALAACISIPIAVKAGMDPKSGNRAGNTVWGDRRISRSAQAHAERCLGAYGG
ncbi:PTS system protein [Salmonella bongori]|nr:PTS system protein [Salmonella bongori]